MDIKTQKNLKKFNGFKFNFNEIKDEHKKAINEACEILEKQGVNEDIINNLKTKFEIKTSIKEPLILEVILVSNQRSVIKWASLKGQI